VLSSQLAELPVGAGTLRTATRSRNCPRPCGAGAPHTSRDVLIPMEQSVEPVASSDGARLVRRRLGEWSSGAGCGFQYSAAALPAGFS